MIADQRESKSALFRGARATRIYLILLSWRNCMATYIPEPFKIKSVEPLPLLSREQREEKLRQAGYNLFLLDAHDVTIDLLTDSGTNAMSQMQWAGLLLGDESYAGSENFLHLRETVKQIFGFDYFVPTHQGRGAEQVLFNVLVQPGQLVPSNTHFDTTRANVEARCAEARDLVIAEGLDPTSSYPFKGNLHLHNLERLIEEVGPQKIPLVLLTITNNAVGGQPVSMHNIRAAKKLVARHGIPLYLDAARWAENCFFIQQREEDYRAKSILDIAREVFSYADGFLMSAKKDGLVNIGGLLATRDAEVFKQIKDRLILTEGFPTYGGLARRDLEAMAIGLAESLEWGYLNYRIGQVRYLGERLMERGVPIVQPPGGHAVFLDAKRFLPQIPQEQFPAQALVAQLYLEGGIRSVEIGSVMFGKRDPWTGEICCPDLELVRLAIPRRVYTRSHLDYVADVIISVYQQRDQLHGMKLVYEAPTLRHFTARFEWV
jgi:tyrosine phenol-lyase